jgi:hypothetical protein
LRPRQAQGAHPRRSSGVLTRRPSPSLELPTPVAIAGPRWSPFTVDPPTPGLSAYPPHSAGMDYPYLNQTGFDSAAAAAAANCSGLPGMDPTGLSSCNIPCTYSDLSRCSGQVSMGQGAGGYGAYQRGAPFSSGSPSCLPSGSSCSMMPRPGDPRQPPMFASGKCSKFLSPHSISRSSFIYSYLQISKCLPP